jgi:hypothetical protein
MPAPAVTNREEAAFRGQVIELVELYDWWSMWTADSRTVRGAGWPDLTLIRPPRILYVELKSRAGCLSGEQWDVLRMLDACGHETAVWRPGDLPTIAAVLGPKGQRCQLVLPEVRPPGKVRPRRGAQPVRSPARGRGVRPSPLGP